MNTDENDVDLGKKIANKLILAIKKDRAIDSSDCLSAIAIQDNLPAVCQTIVEAIATGDPLLLLVKGKDRGYKHGVSRSAQNFEPGEIVKEFYLLKQIIIKELESELSRLSCQEVIAKLALIDVIINQATENTFQSYALLKKEQIKSLHQQIFFTNQEITRLVADHQDSISYLIHEIKNPLTSIIGYSDLFLRQQDYDNSTANLAHIEQVLSQGRNILRLVNDATELSASQKPTDSFQLSIREVEICDLIEDIVSNLKPEVEAKGLELVTSCYPQRLIIKSDALRLQQIITNLLTNAIRYTVDGTIELACSKKPQDLLEIKVSDTGIGIAPESCEHIFEPYFRTSQSYQNIPEGTGLGLAIVAYLVKVLNGKIELTSQVGVGSTFTVIIPNAVCLSEI